MRAGSSAVTDLHPVADDDRGSAQCGGGGAGTLYLPLCFPVNLKMLQIVKSIKKKKEEQNIAGAADDNRKSPRQK